MDFRNVIEIEFVEGEEENDKEEETESEIIGTDANSDNETLMEISKNILKKN